ncbi:hypothetical protein ACIA8K_12805 [Catenuloplanes sp. NPDC051500]|uniref:hypothetical protein n=1 Tax=Catenuloplanes sp. NPDC051500 TaxID=3363959 RepID=UPI0037A552C8
MTTTVEIPGTTVNEVVTAAMFAEDGRTRDAPTREDIAYARVALLYTELVASGCKTPCATLAARHGGNPGRWSNHFNTARQRGFLTRPIAGRHVGGELTELGREILAENGVEVAR